MDIGSVLSISATAVSALAAVGALAIAAAALKSARRGAVATPLLESLSEMVSGIHLLTDGAFELNEHGQAGEAASRERLAPDFRRLAVAIVRIELLERALSRDTEYGDWIRDVTNNLAVNLLQADEFAGLTRNLIATSTGADDKPTWATEHDWSYLRRSIGFRCAQGVLRDLPAPVELPPGVRPLDLAWAERVLRTRDESWPSVYSLDASYLTQTTRLLDDFTREYVQPWATSLIARELLERKPPKD